MEIEEKIKSVLNLGDIPKRVAKRPGVLPSWVKAHWVKSLRMTREEISGLPGHLGLLSLPSGIPVLGLVRAPAWPRLLDLCELRPLFYFAPRRPLQWPVALRDAAREEKRFLRFSLGRGRRGRSRGVEA